MLKINVGIYSEHQKQLGIIGEYKTMYSSLSCIPEIAAAKAEIPAESEITMAIIEGLPVIIIRSMRHPLRLKTHFSETTQHCPFPFFPSSSPGFSSECAQRSDSKHLSDPHSTPRWLHLTLAGGLFIYFFYPSPTPRDFFLISLQKGCISALRLPIGQFLSVKLVCVKWQYMNQVTGKGGRLGHFSGPGEGILKQKAAPRYLKSRQSISWFITSLHTGGAQECDVQTLPDYLLSNEM